MSDSIDNGSILHKNANTPELKKEIITRLLDVWLSSPKLRLWEIFKSADQAGGLPKPFDDRDFIHRIEDIYNKSR